MQQHGNISEELTTNTSQGAEAVEDSSPRPLYIDKPTLSTLKTLAKRQTHNDNHHLSTVNVSQKAGIAVAPNAINDADQLASSNYIETDRQNMLNMLTSQP